MDTKLEITKVHFGTELFKVDFTIDGLPFSIADDNVSDEFDKAMDDIVPHVIDIKELPEKANKGYRCNSVSLSCNTSKKGVSRSTVLSATKVTSAGKADNISTAQCLYESDNPKAKVLPQKIVLSIKEVVRQAKLFIEGNRYLKRLYSEQDLPNAA